MTPLEAILKIKSMFAENELPLNQAEPSAQPIESKKEYSLASGAKVMIDKLEVGGHVSLVDDAGVESPAPAGEHELADGSKIVLDENGIILEVKAPEVAEPVNEDMQQAQAQIVQLQSQVDELKAKIESYEAAQVEASQKFSKGISDLSDVVVGLIQTASAQPSEKPQVFSEVKESKEDKIKRFLEMAKSVK